jgi:hypothetical protein
MSKILGRYVEQLTEGLIGLNSGQFNNLCLSENTREITSYSYEMMGGTYHMNVGEEEFVVRFGWENRRENFPYNMHG